MRHLAIADAARPIWPECQERLSRALQAHEHPCMSLSMSVLLDRAPVYRTGSTKTALCHPSSPAALPAMTATAGGALRVNRERFSQRCSPAVRARDMYQSPR